MTAHWLDDIAPTPRAEKRAESRPWPAPLDDAAYHGVAGEIVRSLAPHTEADEAAMLVQLLAAAGNMVGRGPHLVLDGTEHHLVLYVAIVGATAKARKGTSWGHVRRIVSEADGEWSSRIVGGASSGEGLIYAVRDPVIGVDKNGEPEELEPGVDDKRLLDVESEFSSVLRRASRDGNTLSEQIRQAWETGDLQTLTRGRKGAMPLRATGAHISIIGHITQRELEIRLAESDAWNGLANRFLWICSRRARLLPRGGRLDITAGMSRRLADAAASGRKFGRLPMDDEAGALYDDIYRVLPDEPGLLGAVTARDSAQIARLAGIYAVLDGAAAVHAEHVAAGAAVWQYAYESARHLFGAATGDKVADRILEALREVGERGLDRRELHTALGRHVRAARLDTALEALVQAERIAETQEQTGGRPRRRYRAEVR